MTRGKRVLLALSILAAVWTIARLPVIVGNAIWAHVEREGKSQ